jgi:uncharacterized protein
MLSVIKNVDCYGVFTKAHLKKGQALITLKGLLKPFPSKYSIQINEHNHLHPYSEEVEQMKPLLWPYLNHSCNPNAFIDVNTLQLIALRDIKPHEEITFDYEQTELVMKEPFACNCEAANCRKYISGKKISGTLSSN